MPSPPLRAVPVAPASHKARKALTALACLAAALAGCKPAPRIGLDPVDAANAFLALVEKGDARAAYDSAAFGFQAAQTYDAFLSNARELDLIGGQPPQWTRKDLGGSDARLDGTIITQSGAPVRFSVTLTQDGGQWKLFSLRTATGGPDGEPEDRFTLVGKGTGFNDVYHQPMPSPRELVDLVHGTMSKFNTAVQAANFHDFYRSISQQWRAGQRMNGELAAGVTEKMLKDHFQPFIDGKFDLSPLASLPPVFERPPIIDQDGLLELRGHFNAPRYHANFFLTYAYELPRWRLFGININLTK